MVATKSIAFGILFWFTVPGQMVPDGKGFMTLLFKTATASKNS
jgi:hypothetical protein